MVDVVECRRLIKSDKNGRLVVVEKPAKMSSVILSSAVSVEWSLLYADWTASKSDDVDACGTNRINTSRVTNVQTMFLQQWCNLCGLEL